MAVADPFTERVQALVVDNVGSRVVGINETTRQSIAGVIEKALGTEGEALTASDIASQIRDIGVFNEARAETIARTEVQFAFNSAALTSYSEYGVEMVQAIDGDYDEECAARNGQTFTVEEAMDIEDHPNGTLDWVPFTGAPEAEPTVEDAAAALVDQATAAEPQVTKDLIAIGEQTGLNPNASFTLDGKTFRTLDARLKTEASTLRKMTGELEANPGMTVREVTATMKDNLRYTFISEAETYTASVREATEELVARGYKPLRATNYWEKSGGYAGLNTNWQTADGQLFELQFHTQQGLETKEVLSHPLYEAQRLLAEGSHEWSAYQERVDELWATFRSANGGLGDMPWLREYFPSVR